MEDAPSGSSRPNSLKSTVLRPFVAFINSEASSGIVLIFATLIALAWANSPWSETYVTTWQTQIGFRFGDFLLEKSLSHWINDGLMAVFFFLVGLEIKRECMVGELASLRKASLPIVAAIGGMVFPAAIYWLFNAGTPGVRGWGIPMATDIAFALGVLALVGRRVPLALKVFLAAVAIVDDIGAVLVIAIFYSEGIQWHLLGFAALILCLLAGLNRLGVRSPWAFVLPGLVLWFLFLKSGIHATVAGVLLALVIPAWVRLDPAEFVAKAQRSLRKIGEGNEPGQSQLDDEQLAAIQKLENQCEAAQMPLQRIEHGLQPIVSFIIMPVFALANAGVTIDASAFMVIGQPIGMGIAFGLLLGKPLGILISCWIAVKTGLAVLPSKVNWSQMAGVGALAGIGFTMSLFITELAFNDADNVEAAKVAILIASIVAGIGGFFWLRVTSRKSTLAPAPLP